MKIGYRIYFVSERLEIVEDSESGGTMNKTACLTSVPKRWRVWKGPPLLSPLFFNNTIIRLYIILYGDIIEWHVRFWCYFSFIKCPQPTTIINWKAYYTFFYCVKSHIFAVASYSRLVRFARTIGLYIIYYFSIMARMEYRRYLYVFNMREYFWFMRYGWCREARFYALEGRVELIFGLSGFFFSFLNGRNRMNELPFDSRCSLTGVVYD